MKTFSSLWLTPAAWFTLLPAQAAKTTKPNILYIMCDDMGYGDLGCYGPVSYTHLTLPTNREV